MSLQSTQKNNPYTHRQKPFTVENMQIFFLNSWFLFGIPFLLFILDSSLAFLCDHQCTYFLLSFFIASLFTQTTLASIISMALLCSLESFLLYGSFFLPFSYTIPLIIAVRYIHYYLYIVDYIPVLTAAPCLTIQICLIEPYLTGFSDPLSYTVVKITGNLICVWLFSLTLNYVRQNGTIAHELK